MNQRISFVRPVGNNFLMQFKLKYLLTRW